jgi:hypothetical protein
MSGASSAHSARIRQDFRLGEAAAEVMAEVGIAEDAARPSAVGAGKAPTLRGIQQRHR